jgi:hypothetical protein
MAHTVIWSPAAQADVADIGTYDIGTYLEVNKSAVHGNFEEAEQEVYVTL